MITRKPMKTTTGTTALRRRTFLRGMGGIALGLPFLETFAPSSEVETTANRPSIV